jgi:hypothetical protein
VAIRETSSISHGTIGMTSNQKTMRKSSAGKSMPTITGLVNVPETAAKRLPIYWIS